MQVLNIGGELNWNAREQGLALSGFYYGYFLTQMLGGFLADKYGAKWVVGGSIFTAAIIGKADKGCGEAGDPL